jgi:hypothetical protein
VSLTPVANLPPVSTTLGKLVAKFAAGVADTGGKFVPVSLIPAAILPLVSLTPVANLPPVSLIPVVHLYLQISPRIFEKIRNGPNGILWGWGETNSRKKPEAKNLVTLSL